MMRRRLQGFTLLELLVAIAVFAILSVMAYGGLQNVIDNSERTRVSMERLQQVQMAILHISRDFSQLVQRNIRDEYGNTNNFIMNYVGQEMFVEFTRSGRRNPAELARSNLQRVAYQLEDDKLSRVTWQHLDRSQPAEPLVTPLLDRVESATVRYLDQDNQWSNEWPPLAAGNPDTPSVLTAIEVNIVLSDWGELTRLFMVSG